MYVCGVHAVSGVKSLIPPCNIFNLSLNELLVVEAMLVEMILDNKLDASIDQVCTAYGHHLWSPMITYDHRSVHGPSHPPPQPAQHDAEPEPGPEPGGP